MRLPIIDPATQARALAFHLGRERAAKRAPVVSVLEAAADLREAELEFVMQETPNAAPIRGVTI